MSKQLRLVVNFAHPDDESFGFAGLLAAFSRAGHESTYVVATRGEAGEILVPGLATRENLGAVREQELRTALDILGVGDVRFLGFRDSGMAGSAENADPRAYINQDVEQVAERVADILIEKRPDIVLTYGLDGIYGHPDHIMASKVGTAAVMKAAERGLEIPNLYFSAAPKGRIKWMAEIPNGPFKDWSADDLAKMGTPPEEITTWMDVLEFLPQKLQALRAHRTQVGDNGPLAHLKPDDRSKWLALETARMIPTPWNSEPQDIFGALLPAAPADHVFRT